jgi:chromosome segregation ATPase
VPDVYGSSVIIERTLLKDGGGGYKLKSKDGKTVSTKKDDLQAMLDHFMIQADNPLNVLSQDAARTFLSTSSPKDKYGVRHQYPFLNVTELRPVLPRQLFIRGTQLQQLTEEYEFIGSRISTIKVQLDNKRQVLPELLAAAQAARDRMADAQKATEQAEQLNVMRKQLAWSYVQEEEKVRELTCPHLILRQVGDMKNAHREQKLRKILLGRRKTYYPNIRKSLMSPKSGIPMLLASRFRDRYSSGRSGTSQL